MNFAALQNIPPIYLCDDSYQFGEYLRQRGFFAIMADAFPSGKGASGTGHHGNSASAQESEHRRARGA
jgi:hypothetical protein